MPHRHRTPWIGLCLLLACSLSGTAVPARAAEPEVNNVLRVRTVDTDVELGMLVTGTIEIDAAGQVQRYTIQHRDQLPKAVTTLIDSRVPLWSFEPVALPEGQATTLSRMALRFVAHRAGETDYAVALRGASFQAIQPDAPETHELRLPEGTGFDYPASAAKVGVSAIAYVALRIDPSGKVTDAAIRQVNLRIDANERQLAFWRDYFARESVRQARRLRFLPPTTGPDAGTGPWTITLPLDYAFAGETPWKTPGRWDTYRPGPIRMIPWVGADDPDAGTPPDTAIPSRLQSNHEHRRLRGQPSGAPSDD